MNLATTAPMGRPRKPGARYASGNLKPRTDHGTPEVVAHRLALVGAADATLAHYPLGVALARSIVTLEQHDAGLAYARDYRTAMDGLPRPLEPSLAREMPSAHIALAERTEIARTGNFMAKASMLAKMGRQTHDDLNNLVVFERWPLWLTGQGMPSPKHLRQRARIIAALEALARMG